MVAPDADDSDDDAEMGVCAPAHLFSGFVFAVMFGALGFVVAGGEDRSLAATIGQVFGGSLGLLAVARGSVDFSSASRFGTCASGILVGVFTYQTLFPLLDWDLVLSGLCGALGGWGALTAHAHGSKPGVGLKGVVRDVKARVLGRTPRIVYKDELV